MKKECKVSREVSPYTTSEIHSNKLLLQIQEVSSETPKFDYDYKTDSWHYYLSVIGKVIEGEIGSKAMAICIMYVELFD